MDNSEQPENQPAKKESIKRFVLRATAPFRVETEALGPITARRMTTSGSLTFARRMKSLDGVADAEVVRAYMGSVSGLPVEDEERLPDPLTEEQVAQLTSADVLNFAHACLQHIVKPTEMREDPIAELADYLKHWQQLGKSVVGPVGSLREEMRRMLGPIGSMQASIGDALRDLNGESDRALSALKNFDAHIAFPERPSSFNYEPVLRIPELPPIGETPMGRTAIAVEELSRAGQRMEEAMGFVVEQAGNVSEKMGQVLSKIETESAKSQLAARWALAIGGISLLVSAVALGASAYFSHAGYWADREDARSDGQAARELTEQVRQQTAVLQAMAIELGKGPLAPPGAPRQSAVQTSQRPPASLPRAQVQPMKTTTQQPLAAAPGLPMQSVEQPSQQAPAALISSDKQPKQ
jgi:hypothetical protein